MKVYVTVKQFGKKKGVLTKEMFEISDNVETLKELLSDIVSSNTKSYNERKQDTMIVNYLTNEEITDQVEVGKVGFGVKYRDEVMSVDKRVTEAIQSFEDGLYRVFINDIEIEKLEEVIVLKEEDTLTFIKLTMLAGRMW